MARKIGKVSHYFDKVGVAVLDLEAPLKIGDTVTFQHGENTFSQEIQSMQIDHKQINKADSGTSVGVKVDTKVKPGTTVLQE